VARTRGGGALDVRLALTQRDFLGARHDPLALATALGAGGIEVAPTPVPPEVPADHPARDPDLVRDVVLRGCIEARARSLSVRLVSPPLPPGEFPEVEALLGALAAAGVAGAPIAAAATHLVAHPFMTPRLGWITWSVPPYAALAPDAWKQLAPPPARPAAVHAVARATEPP
jgi:hypothetical protein